MGLFVHKYLSMLINRKFSPILNLEVTSQIEQNIFKPEMNDFIYLSMYEFQDDAKDQVYEMQIINPDDD